MVYGKAKVMIDPDWTEDAKIALGFTLELMFRNTGLHPVVGNLDFMIEELHNHDVASYNLVNSKAEDAVSKANGWKPSDLFSVEALDRTLDSDEIKLMRLYVANYMKEHGKEITLEVMEIDEEREKFTLERYFANDKLVFDRKYRFKLPTTMHEMVHTYGASVGEIRHRLLQKTKNRKRLDLKNVLELAVRIHDGLHDARSMSMFISWDEELDLP